MWLGVHLVYITGFKNRLTTVLHWLVSFLGRGRSERTATEQQIFARAALGRLERGTQDLVSEPGSMTDRSSQDESERRAQLEEQALEEVRLTEGRYASMRGVIDEINEARGKLRVIINMFGRPVPTELSFHQVEKLS